MAILPSVGAQTGNRLAQMIASESQSQRYAGQGLRQLAFRQQLATAQERERKQMLLMAMLQQRAQQRQTKRAARGPSMPSRIGQTLLAGTPGAAFLESDRTVSSGWQPNTANSLLTAVQNAMGMMTGVQGLQQGRQGLQLGQQQLTAGQRLLEEGNLDSLVNANWGQGGGP